LGIGISGGSNTLRHLYSEYKFGLFLHCLGIGLDTITESFHQSNRKYSKVNLDDNANEDLVENINNILIQNINNRTRDIFDSTLDGDPSKEELDTSVSIPSEEDVDTKPK